MAVALLAATLIDFCAKKMKLGKVVVGDVLPFVLVAISSILFVFFYGTVTSDATSALTYSAFNPYFQSEVSQLGNYGLTGCKVISNDWVYLLYYNISAYPPYYFNKTLRSYPIIISEYGGVTDYKINFTDYQRINATNLTIYLPRNYSSACTNAQEAS
jgi:hypothetical protein